MRRLTRALLIAGLSAAAWTAWQAMDDPAARAAETPPAAAQADHPIGSLLDDVATVIDEVRPGRDEAPPPAEDDPEPEPPADTPREPDPAPVVDTPREPTPPPVTPVEDVVDAIGDVLSPVLDPLPDLPPPAGPDVPPVVDPIPRPTVDPTPDEPIDPPVTEAAPAPTVTTDPGVGPPVPTPGQAVDPDLVPVVEQCHDRHARPGHEPYVPPNTRHGYRPRLHQAPQPPPIRPPVEPIRPPTDGVPASAVVSSAGTATSSVPDWVLPAGGAVRPGLGRGLLLRDGDEDTLDRERGILPAPA